MKRRRLAIALNLVLGWTGAHHFYLGNKLKGALTLCLWIGSIVLAAIPGLGGFAWTAWCLLGLLLLTDAVSLGCRSQQWFEYRYNDGPKPVEDPGLGVPAGEWKFWGVLVAVLAIIFIPYMGSFGLWDPWETHYGEVGRQMIERGDWVSTWWGSHWRKADGGTEGRYFYSKPVLLMWMMALGMKTFGFSEWGIRIGVGIIAMGGGFSVYLMGREVWNRRVGAIMLIVLSTSPFWAMLGRQSQTDMPFVGTMTIGMCFLMMGLFGKRRDEPASPFDSWMLFAFILAVFVPQMQLLAVKFGDWRGDLRPIYAFFRYGPTLVVLYSLGMFLVIGSFLLSKRQRTKREVWMLVFYVFAAFATMAKGFLGFALPGAIMLLYFLISREWSKLLKLELPRGILVFIVVGFPWYVAMFMRHGMEYYQRFIVHDHLKRATAGVHQTDNGPFEHFIKWLGYGLFPWGSFLPAALARVSVGKDVGRRTDGQRARLVLVIWAVFSFTFFTMMKTKFHHYIFPCVPAMAMLIGLYLDDILRHKVKSFWPLYLTAVALFVMIGFDLFAEPESLKNMFTYQYDRMWDERITYRFVAALKVMFVIGLGGMLILAVRTRWARIAGLTALVTCSSAVTVWSLDVYMPNLAIDWSQGYLWDTYYDLCTPIDSPEGAPEMKPYCAESIVAYKLNWRGETYYTHNEVIPLEKDPDMDAFLEQNGDRSFFAIMQHGRTSSFRTSLPASLRGHVEEVHDENLKFVLVRVLNEDDHAALEQMLETRRALLDP